MTIARGFSGPITTIMHVRQDVIKRRRNWNKVSNKPIVQKLPAL